MSRKRICTETVTNFFLSTCRQRPPLSKEAVQAAAQCGVVAAMHPDDDKQADMIQLTTGSVAEFYIEPMLPHFGDIDVMFHRSTELAKPQGHPPPTQLPDTFSDNVKIYNIVHSHLPGYVYLELCYLLTKCIEGDKYSHLQLEKGHYLPNMRPLYDENEKNLLIHGPAFLTDMSYTSHALSVDLVQCVRCLSWPPQAADWPARHRNYDWPDSATVDCVVSNGCDVVGVAHSQCKQHEWMGKYQHRLSFSRAEIVLINNWTRVQQIVYHMLRVFVKTELLTDNDINSKALSNYHIKTLMMWTCEEESSSLWTKDLVRICAEQLHTLSLRMKDEQCPHYFISGCNLTDSSSDVKMIASLLNLIDESWLSTWFVNIYIRKCSLLCPDSVSSLFSDVSTDMKLHNAVSAVVNCRLSTARKDTTSWQMLQQAVASMHAVVSKCSLTVRSCIWWMSYLAKTDTRLSVNFIAVAFLHVASKISTTDLNDKLIDVLVTITGNHISTRRHPSQCSSEISLSKATKLMKVVASSSRSTMQLNELIQIELAKAYLHRVFRCKHFESDSIIYCLANFYLAVLYYTTGQYRMAINHCILAASSYDHCDESQRSSHVVHLGELLPKIDDDIDNVSRLTELFAHCLIIRCLSFTQTLSGHNIHRLPEYMSNAKPFIANVLAIKSAVHNSHGRPASVHSSRQPAVNATDMNTSQLVELLQRSAVEQLTTYRQLEARDFGSVATIVTTDFEALYVYKHGDYQRCLQLSTQNLHALLNPVQLSGLSTFSEFIQLLDDDIVSLMALTLMVNPKCRDQGINVFITHLTLSLYLMTQCQLKLHHSLSSLAETFEYITVAQTMHTQTRKTLDQFVLKLTKRKLLMHCK